MNEEQGPDVVPGYANTSAQSSVVMFNRDDPGYQEGGTLVAGHMTT